MGMSVLEKQFARMGVRVKQEPLPRDRRAFTRNRETQPFVSIDIRQDRLGEYFAIQADRLDENDVSVVHAQPEARHLLLMTRDRDGEKHKFLCGHDERHWFVAAVPESANAASVPAAMQALKPAAVRFEELSKRVRPKNRNRRRNAAFRRQGEWFFVPVPHLNVKPNLVLHNEPLRRGAGKPHLVEFLYRSGGETVYVCRQHPNGLTAPEYSTLLSRNPGATRWNWTVMRRNPEVYARGKVRHSDHKTIELMDWHRVLLNTESQAVAMRQVAFLD